MPDVAEIAGRLSEAQRHLLHLAATSEYACTIERDIYDSAEIVGCLMPFKDGRGHTHPHYQAFKITSLGLAVRACLENSRVTD